MGGVAKHLDGGIEFDEVAAVDGDVVGDFGDDARLVRAGEFEDETGVRHRVGMIGNVGGWVKKNLKFALAIAAVVAVGGRWCVSGCEEVGEK